MDRPSSPPPAAASVRTRGRSPASSPPPHAPSSPRSGAAAGGSTSRGEEEIVPSSPRATPTTTSVRTRLGPPTEPPDVPWLSRSGGGAGSADDVGRSSSSSTSVDDIIARMRDAASGGRFFVGDVSGSGSWSSAAVVTGKGKGKEKIGSFSFPDLGAPPVVADAAAVVDHFATVEAERREKARGEFFDATMEATASARLGKIKMDLLVDRRVLDLAGLERWLRRGEAVAELAWFTELCAGEGGAPVPPLELFECAFRALQAARSDELHRGADFRKHWVGPVAVPEFFLCPISNKVMENPVVISSGKTVEVLALEKWWSENRRLCPVTDEILDNSIFIPNILIMLCTALWRTRNGITDVMKIAEPPNISSEEEALFREISLLALSPSLSDKTFDAILRLHELISNAKSSLLHLLGQSPGMIAKLACLLPETCLDPDPGLDDIILKIIAKTASYNPNKVILGDDQYAIPVLIARALLGPVDTRVKCAKILGLLADNYYNKIKIGELGGFAALMELLLLVGDKDVKRTVAMAIASLCEAQENWSRFVREGVADAAISLLRDDNLVDEAHSIFLQASGFELAMTQVLDKLMSFGDDANCAKMVESLWNTFIRVKLRRKRGNVTHASSSTRAGDIFSDTSSEGSVELPMHVELTEQAENDVRTIVSWLQKRTCYPRTYRYED
uniref:RING-type E3 ubiquitin transferase n=1 Tax=Oryza punctata TaxID=4537 RepID=A0A0E0KPI0_ORYPU